MSERLSVSVSLFLCRSVFLSLCLSVSPSLLVSICLSLSLVVLFCLAPTPCIFHSPVASLPLLQPGDTLEDEQVIIEFEPEGSEEESK